MPIHLASLSSLSASSKAAPHRSRLSPLNIMHSLSLSRKSGPTCTLSLAHVSACNSPPCSPPSSDDEAMQVDTAFQLDCYVAVPVPQAPLPPKSLKRTKTTSIKTTATKTKMTTRTIPNDINVIPFPTSAQTTTTTTTTLHDSACRAGPESTCQPTNSFKRPQVQKKEGLEHLSSTVPSSISPPRKRARKSNLSTTPALSRSSTPSPRVRALAQRVPPTRPSTPTPDCRSDPVDDEMTITDKSPVQPSPVCLVQEPQQECTQPTSQGQEHEQQAELPPYSAFPPPYSPLAVVAPIPMASISPIPLLIPIPVVPLSSLSSSTCSNIVPPTPPTSPPRPLPPSRPLSSPPSSPPPPPPSSSPPPPQRSRQISTSELKFFIFLYRTLVSGLEMRQQNRANTQQVRRARDGSRREQHLDGVLIEVDDDEDDDIRVDVHNVDAGSATAAVIEAMDSSDNTNEPTPSSLNEDLEVQDALLALRLRNFLKWNGVDESMLKPDFSNPSISSMKPFLEDGSSRPDKMDVDVQQTSQPMSNRHLITVLRMRGTCGPRQGPSGFKNKGEKSKLRICSFKAGDES